MAIHGPCSTKFMPSATIRPQSGDGGCEPTPRKLSVVVDKIVPGSCIDTVTIKIGTIFGRIYRNISDQSDSPKDLPVSINAIFFIDIVLARTIRA